MEITWTTPNPQDLWTRIFRVMQVVAAGTGVVFFVRFLNSHQVYTDLALSLVLLAFSLLANWLIKTRPLPPTTGLMQFTLPRKGNAPDAGSDALSRQLESKLKELLDKYGTTDIEDPRVVAEFKTYAQKIVSQVP